MQLGKSYIEDIERICRAADDYVAEGNNDEAYRKYKAGLRYHSDCTKYNQ